MQIKALPTPGQNGNVIQVTLANDPESHIMWLLQSDLEMMKINDETKGWTPGRTTVRMENSVRVARAVVVEVRLVDEASGKPISSWFKEKALVAPSDHFCRTIGSEIRKRYEFGYPSATRDLVLGSTKREFGNYFFHMNLI